MLACRLCLAFGEQDPEQWLENCPKRVIDVWRAFAAADRWEMNRRLSVGQSITTRKLLSLKYTQDSRKEVLESIDRLVDLHMPIDMQIGEDTRDKSMSESVLEVMSRGGEVVKTPVYTVEIEADPWQRR